jgi:low temperature requirement protein LtrA
LQADAKENANNYYNDDILQRCGILWIMALRKLRRRGHQSFAGHCRSIPRHPIHAGKSKLLLRSSFPLSLTVHKLSSFLMYSFASHHHRLQNRIYAGLTFIGLFIWVPLYFEDVSDHAKIGVAFAALIWEEIAYLVGFSPVVTNILRLEYTTAVDIDHEVDRYTAFTIIVLGEFTYAILAGSPAEGGLTTGLLRAVWTLVIAFCFNSMYVYNDGSIECVHPVRRSVWTAFPWLLIHLPMSAGLLIGGHVSAYGTNHVMETGHRWLWGGGLGVGMLCMWVLAQLFSDCDDPGKLLLPKVLPSPVLELHFD